jgi:hypothetical protein
MSHHDRHLRRLATVVAAVTLAAVAASPAGAWPDPSPGDGTRQGSMPSNEVQAFVAKKQVNRSSAARKTPRARATAGKCRRPMAVGKVSTRSCRVQVLARARSSK